MQIFDNPIQKLEWYIESKSRLKNEDAHISLTGIHGVEKAHIISAIARETGISVIVVEDDLKARELMEEYSFFDKNVRYFPAKDLIFYQADINGKELETQRMYALSGIMENERQTIITTMDALMAPVPLTGRQNMIAIKKNGIIEENGLAKGLVKMGYRRMPLVTGPGEYSIRGDIIDIYDLVAENPVRIELWGDQVESIRAFDVLSQRSVAELESVNIMPAAELMLTDSVKEEAFHKIKADADRLIKEFSEQGRGDAVFRIKELLEALRVQLLETDTGMNLESFVSYFYEDAGTFLDLVDKADGCIFVCEPDRCVEHGRFVEMEFTESMTGRLEKGYCLPGQAEILKPVEYVLAALEGRRVVTISAFIKSDSPINADISFDVNIKGMPSFNGSFNMLVTELAKRKKAGASVVIVSPSRTRANRLAQDLSDENVYAAYTEDLEKKLEKGQIFTVYGNLKKGFEYPDAGFLVISEADIFGAETVRKKRKRRYGGGQKITGYSELKIGDYVIHEDHGLGVYKGIEKVSVDNITKDYMKIEYRDGGNLYVLASNFDAVQLYADSSAKKPKLNKLSGQEWAKTKTKVRESVGTVAKELVTLYAARTERNGYQYGKDTVWQQEFEEMFPYEPTIDQALAIDATKSDMESTKIMDRLICGDVGFGKTEVAIRAAFKAVQEGKQVAYLVPTTILAQQHYNNFAERMKDYPVRVAMLSRFCTGKQIRETLSALKKGLVDIVIGTHRIVSKDVEFKDLGLLIIDEEQRFGVAAKEKIKQLKENVDVLTLTATPIPRTLHMSLIGIRDMSLLEEPPMDRLPIQTYVLEYNEEMVREAIKRELSRNGQVYYVYNRVNNIDDIAMKIQSLVPEARVSFAHGQMQEKELELIMMEFVNHEIDVLVSTTIIETGLDIPNVNTMIIHDSDAMGLSQLYQLRGRVGRSNRTSFAFLMYQRNKLLKETAEKRLAAIKEFTDLGSGYKIAMKDLEIRGAGTLLGKQQHGHIEAVGYDLYCKLLEEAVAKEKGENVLSGMQTTVDLEVGAFIPAEYIVNESQKLDMYKRIASIENKTDYDDMTDEMKDRFGSVPQEADNLLRIALIKKKASSLYITEVKGVAGRIRLVMDGKAPVEIPQIPVLLNEYGGELRFISKGIPTFALVYRPVGLLETDQKILLEKTEELLEKMEMLYVKDEG